MTAAAESRAWLPLVTHEPLRRVSSLVSRVRPQASVPPEPFLSNNPDASFWNNLLQRQPERKFAIIFDGGGTGAIYAAQVADSLTKLNLGSQNFDLIVGNSAGAIIATNFASGQTAECLDIWLDDMTGRQLINPFRLVNPFTRRMPVDLDYLETTIRSRGKLNEDRILAGRPDVYVGVTDRDGKGHFLNLKDPSDSDMIRRTMASSAMPILGRAAVRIDDIPYGDGLIGCGVPIKFAAEQKCTDILVVVNQPLENGTKRLKHHFESALVRALMAGKYPKGYVDATLRRDETYRASFTDLPTDVNVTVLAAPRAVGRMQRDRAILESVAAGAEAQVVFTVSQYRQGADRAFEAA